MAAQNLVNEHEMMTNIIAIPSNLTLNSTQNKNHSKVRFDQKSTTVTTKNDKESQNKSL